MNDLFVVNHEEDSYDQGNDGNRIVHWAEGR